MQPEDPNKYDFLLNPDKGQRNVGPNFGNKKRQILIGGAFVITVLAITGIVASLIFSSGGGDGGALVALEAHQTEIDRVITLGQKNISDPVTKQEMGTYQTTIISDKRQLASLLSQREIEVTSAELATQKNSKNDSALTDALVIDAHDKVLQELVESLTTKYYSALKQAKSDAKSNKEVLIIDTAIFNIETIYRSN